MDVPTTKLIHYYENHRKVEIAYIFWLLAGFLGGHRFYMRKQGSAVAMLIMTIIIIGIPFVFIWWLIDGILMPQMIRDQNRELRWDLGLGEDD